jgi:hypothetical protein
MMVAPLILNAGSVPDAINSKTVRLQTLSISAASSMRMSAGAVEAMVAIQSSYETGLGCFGSDADSVRAHAQGRAGQSAQIIEN